MLEILFSISLFFTGGNIIDTKLNLHKYEEKRKDGELISKKYWDEKGKKIDCD